MKAGPDEGPTRAGRASPEPERHHDPAPPPPSRATPPARTIEPKPDVQELTPETLWARTIETVGDKPSALARLEAIELVRIEGGVAFVRPVSAAHASRVRSGVSWLEARFGEAAGRTIRVRVEDPGADEPSAVPPAQPGLDDAALRREAEGNKLVRTAMDLFQARLLSVEDAPRETGDSESPGADGDED